MQPTPHLRIVVDNVAQQRTAPNVGAPPEKRRDTAAAFSSLARRAWGAGGHLIATAGLVLRLVFALPVLVVAAMLRMFYGTVLFLFGLAVLATLWLGPLKALFQTITG